MNWSKTEHFHYYRLQSTERKARCCRDVAEKTYVAPACCNQAAVQPICCGTPGHNFRCCMPSDGYCCTSQIVGNHHTPGKTFHFDHDRKKTITETSVVDVRLKMNAGKGRKSRVHKFFAGWRPSVVTNAYVTTADTRSVTLATTSTPSTVETTTSREKTWHENTAGSVDATTASYYKKITPSKQEQEEIRSKKISVSSGISPTGRRTNGRGIPMSGSPPLIRAGAITAKSNPYRRRSRIRYSCCRIPRSEERVCCLEGFQKSGYTPKCCTHPTGNWNSGATRQIHNKGRYQKNERYETGSDTQKLSRNAELFGEASPNANAKTPGTVDCCGLERDNHSLCCHSNSSLACCESKSVPVQALGVRVFTENEEREPPWKNSRPPGFNCCKLSRGYSRETCCRGKRHAARASPCCKTTYMYPPEVQHGHQGIQNKRVRQHHGRSYSHASGQHIKATTSLGLSYNPGQDRKLRSHLGISYSSRQQRKEPANFGLSYVTRHNSKESPNLGLSYNSGSVTCGGVPFSNRASVCCDGKVRAKSGFSPACCGSRVYDAAVLKCCSDGTVRKSCQSAAVATKTAWGYLLRATETV